MTREASIEKYLKSEIERYQGLCIKLVPFSLKGVPDRLIVLSGPYVVFAEVKRPVGGKIAEHQYIWKARLERLGCHHRFIHTRAQVDALLEDYDQWLNTQTTPTKKTR